MPCTGILNNQKTIASLKIINKATPRSKDLKLSRFRQGKCVWVHKRGCFRFFVENLHAFRPLKIVFFRLTFWRWEIKLFS